ncbi:hypothetical protein LVJ94_17995 [Pendulispora rubella]|uniref:Uncharacterized protein n=1 Tax=Pendulispora rubella TaxID=2741070 RepID=A0ABZ2LDV5_9BACT
MGENDQGERGGGGSSRRRRLEGVIPDLIKRAVEIGVEKAAEAPDTVKHIMSELKLPKGMAGYVLAQIDETKNGVVRVVANEVRDFLEHTNLAGEAQKILTSLQFEVNTTIRFRPNSGSRDSRDGRDKSDKSEDSDAPEENDDSSGEDGPLANLPKPEVKTDIYVKREERRERRTRSKE